jgi:hypothetical protein
VVRWTVLKNRLADGAASFDVRLIRGRVQGWLLLQLRVTGGAAPRGAWGEAKRAVLALELLNSRVWSGLRMASIRWIGTGQAGGVSPGFATKI